MPITHAKTCAKPDGPDSSQILSSDWNADHVGGTTISDTDPGAIGAGNIWVRTDPTGSYGPQLQVRNSTDDGWVDEANSGLIAGLTAYDNTGAASAIVYAITGSVVLKVASGVTTSVTLTPTQIILRVANYWLRLDQDGRLDLNNQAFHVLAGGAFVTRQHAAPADADLDGGDLAFWFDETNGAAKLMLKGKSADETVVTGSVDLT
jgi:hypothetical protein